MATVNEVKIRLGLEDSDGRKTSTDFNIEDALVTVDAGLLTAIDGFVDDCLGDVDGSKAFSAGVESIQLVVDVAPTTVVGAATGDVGVKWQFGFPDGTRRSLGARSTYGQLTSLDSKGELADKTNAAITTLVDRMFNDPGDATTPGLGIQDEAGNNPDLAAVAIRATRSRRARPRI